MLNDMLMAVADRRSCTPGPCGSDVSMSLFQFRYDIDTIFTKYRDIDIDIDIKYASKMHVFADFDFIGQVCLVFY